jgi:hypothetical protein
MNDKKMALSKILKLLKISVLKCAIYRKFYEIYIVLFGEFFEPKLNGSFEDFGENESL